MLMAPQTSLSAERTARIAVGGGLGLIAPIRTMTALPAFGVVFEPFAAAVNRPLESSPAPRSLLPPISRVCPRSAQ